MLVEGANLFVSVVAVCASRGFGQSVPVNREMPFVVGFITYPDIVGHWKSWLTGTSFE